ncbi:MAG: hypothetical protein HFG05_02420 [Oscillibacter sp.]|nr:hypothetical protein [Oscillibacter sp.]
MLLTFRKEREHGIYISENIANKDEIMYPVYQQATDALRSIVAQAKAFEKESHQADSVGIYGYCHNIIAFSGSRGQGKTSAMLSFSKALEDSFWAKDQGDPLSRCGFTVLPPIDPTVLEQDQSILAVILSRMYRQAEREWTSSRNYHKFSDDSSESEAKRNALLRLFQQCLSGINNIKFREGREIRGLIEMHEISDSAVLKDNFNKLTTNLLEFVRRDEREVTPFLVVQLDDTDFQVRKSYEIMEDIRKYLTIPNMIILMATDLNMLRATLTQHLVRDFYLKMDREILKGIIDVNKLWKIESKHLDKLIPPTRAICLPHLDNIIRQQGEDIYIRYLEKDGEDILLPSSIKSRDEDKEQRLSLQEAIFQFVYRKTRVAFAGSKENLHKMLPTTLRGLAQFLVVFSSMRDVFEISKTLKEYNDTQKLSECVGEQVGILETNLSLFENYFLNDWIHAKLPVEKAGLFERLTAAAMEKQCWCAHKALRELYDAAGRDSRDLNTYSGLMAYIQDLESRFLEPDDMYVFFAVRMFFDFQAHKMVARQKRMALEARKGDRGLLIFDFKQCAGNFPNTLSLEGTEWSGLARDLRKDQYDRIFRGISDKKFGRVLFQETGESYRFDPLRFVPFFLTLGNDRYKKIMRGETDQGKLYLVQTACATIAINQDVQDVVRKALENNPPSLKDRNEYWKLLEEFFQVVNRAIEGINSEGEASTRMVVSWMGEILDFMKDENRSEFRNLLVRMKAELTQDHLKALIRIYHSAELFTETAATVKTAEDEEEVGNLWRSFVDASSKYSISDMKGGLDLPFLESMINCRSNELPAAAVDFEKEFKKEFQSLCRYLEYSFKDVKNRAKEK